VIQTPKRFLELGRVVSTWSLPTKFLVSALLSALGGAGVLSYLVEYATYSYALAFGFRPPVEGIPYLRTTVTAGSLFLLLSGAVIAATLLLSLGTTLKVLTHSQQPLAKIADRFRTLSPWKAALVGAAIMVPVALFAMYLSPIICSEIPALDCKSERDARIALAAPFGFAVGIILFLIRTPAAVWWFVSGYTALYYVAVISLIFTPTAYATFLRFTGFGGGVPVVLQLEESKASAVAAERPAFLMLRTAAVFVLYDPTTERFEEYPLEKVHRLTYATGGMYRLSYRLPAR
jgi:hypothetical protein